MFNNILTNNPCVILKKSISNEFQEILEEPRVQQLLLLLDRINEYSSFVFTNTIAEFEDESDSEDLRLTIRCYIQQIDIDMGTFNHKLKELKHPCMLDKAEYLTNKHKKHKRKALAYSNCAGFKK